MNIIALIPARLSSTRFNRKLMMDLCGKSVITRTYNAVVSTNLFTSTIVVTQDQEIYQEILSNNGNSILIEKEYNSGTDRIADACIDIEADVIINIQGDEPFINKASLEALINIFTSDIKKVKLNIYQKVENFLNSLFHSLYKKFSWNDYIFLLNLKFFHHQNLHF